MDENKFISLVKHHEAAIYKVCWMFAHNDGETVRDLYQEIVLRLWDGYKTKYHPENKDFNWIYRISLNTAISYQRNEKRRKTALLELNSFNLHFEEVADSIVDDLYYLINQLDDLEKSIIYLYLERKKHEEISQIVGLSVSNVGTKIQRIKQKLKNIKDNQ